jgi:hypothetical protein
MSKLIKIILITIFLLVVIFLIVNESVLSKNLKSSYNQKLEINTGQENQEGSVNKEEVKNVEQSLSQNCFGVVEGSLMFPSEKIPDGMYVCVRNIDTGYEYCSDKNIESDRFRYKKGYRLEAPSGQYVAAGIYREGLGNSQIDKVMEFKYTGCKGSDCHNGPLLVFSVECNKIIENINLFDGWRVDFFRKFFSKEEQSKLESSKK